jgi:hypothetical protein
LANIAAISHDSVAFAERVEEMITAVSTRNKTKSHTGGED